MQKSLGYSGNWHLRLGDSWGFCLQSSKLMKVQCGEVFQELSNLLHCFTNLKSFISLNNLKVGLGHKFQTVMLRRYSLPSAWCFAYFQKIFVCLLHFQVIWCLQFLMITYDLLSSFFSFPLSLFLPFLTLFFSHVLI